MTIIAKGIPEFASESGHWYTRDGKPMYTVVGANGKERPTTLADARKLDLVPSVSTILQMEAKPQLTRWMVEQGMLACMTLPRLAGETDSEFMSRALKDSKEQSQKAAARGTYLHGVMEETIRSGVFSGAAEDANYLAPALDWIHGTFPGYSWRVEKSFAHHLGYGGKIDLTGTHPEMPPVTMDYKFKDFGDAKKRLAYDEHCSQLAAYSEGMGYQDYRCFNLFISSRVPGMFTPHEWSAPLLKDGWDAFLALHQLWCIRKRFK